MTLQSLTPYLALIGTIAVALLGFYQWRKQNLNPNRAANAAGRREAYEGLWQMLEQINLDLREHSETNPNLFKKLREVNTYFLSHSLHFDDKDQELINEYITAMSVLRERIYTLDDADVAGAFRSTMAAIPVVQDTEIMKAAEEVKRLRAKVKSKVQRVAGSV
ncbi:MAG: hypothetical protein WBQ94_22780 [Terracidiphilus sp.]